MEKKYWVALMQSDGIKPKKFYELLDTFGSVEDIWQASDKLLSSCNILTNENVAKLIRWRNESNPDDIMQKILDKGIKVVTIKEDAYPKLLKKIYDPPPVLYYKGHLPVSENIIAIVGSRRATAYGRNVTEKLANKLAEHGFIIISGMARGIDSFSHKGALSGDGETIAVLGSGVDIIYPPENKYLYHKIIENGCVISEFPPGSPPEPWHFPARNRVISGMARGVIIVEAAEKSGALITADYALEQGREVFSVPGPITSKYSKGTNNLIKQGAKPVTCLEDVLEEFNIKTFFSDVKENNGKSAIKLNEEENKILEILENEEMDIDTIAQKTGLPLSAVNAACIIMEMKGFIKKLPGKKYIKIV